MPGLLAGRGLLRLDRPRGVGDVGLAGAEALEAAAGAGHADRDVDARVGRAEALGRELHERPDGARAVGADRAREVRVRARSGRLTLDEGCGRPQALATQRDQRAARPARCGAGQRARVHSSRAWQRIRTAASRTRGARLGRSGERVVKNWLPAAANPRRRVRARLSMLGRVAIILVRHAEAEDRALGTPDPERTLVAAGRRAARATGQGAGGAQGRAAVRRHEPLPARPRDGRDHRARARRAARRRRRAARRSTPAISPA